MTELLTRFQETESTMTCNRLVTTSAATAAAPIRKTGKDFLPGLALTLLLLPFASPGMAQSTTELRTLFFDAVYPDDPTEILLSSGQRDSMESAVMPPQLLPENQPQQDASAVVESIRESENTINSLIESGGIYSPELAQEYLSLGELYQQSGDFERAVQAYENTMHIHRVNGGLFTLDQTQAVRHLIEGNKAAGNLSEADKYHEYLYFLMKQSLEPDDDDLVAASLEWADWNMEAFRRQAFQGQEGLTVMGSISSVPSLLLRRGELVAVQDDNFNEILFVPRSVLINNPYDIRMQSYTADQLLDPRLENAEDIYETLLEGNPDNREVVQQKANILHLFKLQLEELLSENVFGSNIAAGNSYSLRSINALRRGYSENREALESVAVSLEDGGDITEAARAWIDLGDWDLSFDRLQRALESYRKARELLLGEGYTEAAVTTFITPSPALFAPQYTSWPDTRSFLGIAETTDIPYIGYIDVTFSKRTNGSLRRISIESASENTGQQLRRRLIELLRAVKVRPLIVEGEAQEQSDIKVRYYYSY